MARSKKLTTEEIQNSLKKLSDWTLNEKGEIARTLNFKDFPHALLCVNAVAYFSEVLNHHPDILIRYRQITFTLITHDAGGLTSNDFELASKIDALSNSSISS